MAIFATIWAVPSHEPSSTTMTSYSLRSSSPMIAARVRAMLAASLYAITTKLTEVFCGIVYFPSSFPCTCQILFGCTA